MHTVNALKVRQAFGKILKDLRRKSEPILIEKGRQPVAVLISIKDFQEHYVNLREKKKKEEFLDQVRRAAVDSPQDSLSVLHELRYGSSH